MSVAAEIPVLSIEECQRLGPPLRRDLEVLDDEIRRLVARMCAEAKGSGADDALFLKASTTVILSIAAGLTACAAEDRGVSFDAAAFIAGAKSAAQWARSRRLRHCFAGQA